MRISKEEFVKRFGEPVNFPHDEWQIIEVTGEEIYEWVTDLGIVLVDETELLHKLVNTSVMQKKTQDVEERMYWHGQSDILKRILGEEIGKG